MRNLDERVKIETLRESLSEIFREYGNIIDIVAKPNLKAKGQAFVVFDKPEAAQAAIEEVQGFELFDKPMQVTLARTRSDATVKSLGNDEEFEHHKRRRLAEKGACTMFNLNFPLLCRKLTKLICRQEESSRGCRRAKAAQATRAWRSSTRTRSQAGQGSARHGPEIDARLGQRCCA